MAQYSHVPEIGDVLPSHPNWAICGCVVDKTLKDPILHPLFGLNASELKEKLASKSLYTYVIAKAASLTFSCLSDAIDAGLAKSLP